MNRRAWSAPWWLAWFLPLLAALLATGIAVAVAEPDWQGWTGTEPGPVADSPEDQARQPAVAVGSTGRVAVAWNDRETGIVTRNIYVALSTDSGKTWSSQVLTTPLDDSRLPDVVAVDDRVFVTWVENDPFTAVREQEVGAGTIRQVPITFTIPVSDYGNTRPCLVAGEGRLHVVFNAGDPPVIHHASRLLTETTWPTATVVHTGTLSGGAWYPVLALGADGQDLYLIWREVGCPERAIEYVHGQMSGDSVTWDSTEVLADDADGDPDLVYPGIAADSNGDLHAVWGEEVGAGGAADKDHYVRYMRYDASGGSWISSTRIYSLPLKVNAKDPQETTPALAVLEKDGEVKICVVWHGFLEDAAVPAEEVLVSCSSDGGETWSQPQSVSRSPGDPLSGEDLPISMMPSVAFDDVEGQLHVVWQESIELVGETPYYEIYHARELHKRVFLPLAVRNWY